MLPTPFYKEPAFYTCSSLTSVTIPNSVTNIDGYAFVGCSGLTSVAISNTLTSIGQGAFAGCSGLTSLTIPNSVTTIDNSAFNSCSGLKSVTVNWSTPLSINSTVFSGVALSTITLNVPSGTAAAYDSTPVWTDFNPIVEFVVAPIVGQTFAANGINYSVTKATLPYEAAVGNNTTFVGAATIPASVTNAGNSFAVTSIGNNAFYGSTSLTSVTLPSSVINIGNGAFLFCSFLTAVTLPNAVTTIGNSSFASCFGLTSINIPNSVTSLGAAAFGSCIGLTEVKVNWTTPLTINANVFDQLDLSTIALNVPSGTEMAYKTADVWKDFGTNSLNANNFAVNNKLEVYPNPAQSQINFSQEVNNLEIFDIAGKKVKSFQKSSSTFDVSNLKKGVYILTGKTIEGKSISEKLIKE